MGMKAHVIKYEYSDGEKLIRPESWCGKSMNSGDWFFTSAQHVALSAGGSTPPCKNCVKAIIKQLEKEL